MTKKVHGSHGSRWVALQGLYAVALTGGSLSRIEADLLANTFHSNKDHTDGVSHKISFDKPYLHELLDGIGGRKDELDALMAPYLDREVEEISPIEHSILYIALYELKERIEIPYKVIINEAIILAKQFGAQDSHKFVNGVLDKAAKQVRSREFSV